MANQSMAEDLVMEILSRASPRTVARCRLVSKAWKDLTYQPCFVDLRSKRAPVISGFFVESAHVYKDRYEFVSQKIPSNLSLGFLPGHARILASTNQGLLLCENTEPQCYQIPEFYVCKPTTKEWEQIPNPEAGYFNTQAIGMVILKKYPTRYKIIQLSEPDYFQNLNRVGEHDFRCEIFDSEIWAWKKLENVYLTLGELFDYRPAISSLEFLYWLTNKKNILSFHVEEETWVTLSVPETLTNESFDLQLIEYQGKLGLICENYMNDYCFDLWVMKHYSGERIWERKETVTAKPLLNPDPFHSPEIALISCRGKTFFYIFTDGSFEGLRFRSDFDGPHGIFPFQSDSELCNLKNNGRIKDHPPQEELYVIIPLFL